MREELRNKLNRHRLRFVDELGVTTKFLAALISENVINDEEKATIEWEKTPHAKVDKLIEILGRKPDDVFHKFCEALEGANSDLHGLLIGGSGSAQAIIFDNKQSELVRKSCTADQLKEDEHKKHKFKETDAKSPQITQASPNQKVCFADEDNYELNLTNPSETEIAKYIAGFEKVRSKLEDYIDPWNKLHSCFVDFDIMTPAEADEFDCRKPNATRVLVAKMKECLKNNSRDCIPMLNALVKNDQTHIAKYIVSFGKDTNSPDRVLTKGEQEAISQNMFCLEKLIRPYIDEFLFELVEVGCITDNHKNWVLETTKTKKHVNELFEILKRRSFKHLTDFGEWLQEAGHDKIVDVLTKGGVVEIIIHLKGIGDLSKEEKKRSRKESLINSVVMWMVTKKTN